MRTIRIKTPIVDTEVGVKYTEYTSGGAAILLVDPETEERLFTATVNLPDDLLEDGCVWLKGWSENEGIPEALQTAGVVKLTGVRVPTGFCYAEEAKLVEEIR